MAHIGASLTAAQLYTLARSGWRKALDAREIAAVAAGSMLPDMLDKPLGHVLLPGVFGSGRSFAHSLAFLALLLTAWLGTRRRLLGLTCACAAGHLALDRMWKMPEVLFWPYFGPAFPRTQLVGFLPWAMAMAELSRSPSIYLPEAVGLALVAANILASSVAWRSLRP